MSKPDEKRWISVEDRIPHPWEKVIIFDTNRPYVGIDCITEIDGFKNPWWGIYRDDENANVTHWMPLPCAPEESQ
ncbi:MAG: DUF551 domain-containing protein [Candidatus Scalindua sp.]